jgi:hypothetical protein
VESIAASTGNLAKRIVTKERNDLNRVSYTKIFDGLQQELIHFAMADVYPIGIRFACLSGEAGCGYPTVCKRHTCCL